jgi:para-nitrobenzyl esterase
MTLLFIGVTSYAFELDKEVKIDSGLITGVQGRAPSIMVFKGIPYASPPVGKLRWKPPQPVTPWKGVRACDEFGPSAIQAPQAPFMMWSKEFIIDTSLGYSEDCLTLNVWTDAESKDAKRPVLLFIHGGAYTSGGSSCEIYDGEGLAKKGVVMVTINYRLGVFGFFAHPHLTAESIHKVSGNYGILDMVAALKWVKKNISAFGGDPDNVTIQGQSAGASAVHILLLSPLAKGLFHRAIPQSFNVLGRKMQTLVELEETGQKSEIVDNNGTPFDRSDDQVIEPFGTKSLAEMRAMKAEDLLSLSFPATPNIDGYVLPADILEIYKTGRHNDVPVIVGMVKGDAMLFGEGARNSPLTLDQYKKNAGGKYGEFADQFLEAYHVKNDAEAAAQSTASALDNLNVLSFYMGKLRALRGKSKTYIYYFTHVMPGPESATHGAFHTADVPYSFNYLSPLRKGYWKGPDHKVGDMMSTYWTNFTRSGNPNGMNLPKWPEWTESKIEFMELGNIFTPISLSREKVNFWKAFYDKTFGLQ